jgi:CRP-like cAMP-binding protein
VQIESSPLRTDLEFFQVFQDRSIPILCNQDRVLFCQGETATGIFILHEGSANLFKRGNENDSVICLRATGPSIIGLPSVLGRHPNDFTAIAESGARVTFVHQEDLTNSMNSDPPLMIKVLRLLAAEVDYARQAISTSFGHSRAASARRVKGRKVGGVQHPSSRTPRP